ncbi:hypothetical protein R1sor_000442 [Riccia sorocarpa]|uniref:AAA+ ATPase domain-containing protein n=1 Tax=Riccia sorocarpa TaxID=122646 RepID=A0ABD3GWC0_9MARC
MSGHMAALAQGRGSNFQIGTSTSVPISLNTFKNAGAARTSFSTMCFPKLLNGGIPILALQERRQRQRYLAQRVGASSGLRLQGLTSTPPSNRRLSADDGATGNNNLICHSSSNGSPLILPVETSTPDDTSPTSDSEEGAPVRKSRFSFLQRFLHLVLGLLKRFSFIAFIRGFVSFLKSRWKQLLLWSVIGSTVGLVYLCTKLTGDASPQRIAYSDFIDHLNSKTVSTVLFEEGTSNVFFNVRDESEAVVVINDGYKEDVPTADGVVKEKQESLADAAKVTPAFKTTERRPALEWQYSTRRIRNDEVFLLPAMRDAGVKYSSAPQSMSASLKAVLITVITLWIPLSPLLWLLHRQLSQNSSSSQRRKKNVSRVIKFDDVAGVDVAKMELMEIVSCMKGASQFATLGAKLPKGVLLVGPPGTGKTLLARAVAGEAGVPFFAASASEFVEMFVGRGAARIRELFAEARKNTPSIVFIDELDAVGGRRGRSFNDERDQTLNQLLTEMDGFDGDSGVLVLAATNRPEALDPALCRPGRLSRRVHVTEPDQLGRQQVLTVHMRGIPVQEDRASLTRVVASMTPGFVGADLANLVNEAAMLAARKEHEFVSLEDFKEAIERVKYGVGDRRRTVFDEVEQKLGSWFNKTWQDSNGYPALPARTVSEVQNHHELAEFADQSRSEGSLNEVGFSDRQGRIYAPLKPWQLGPLIQVKLQE